MFELSDENLLKERVEDHKLVIYQIFTRLFGNPKNTNKEFGTIEENGVGKFNDISEKALSELKKLGITHLWYTGVIEHATMTDFTAYGIPLDDADVIKGRAGSPYAIKDYYDVSPELANCVPDRMKEFDALIERTHKQGLKVIIDFVPNHVARAYHSDAKPTYVRDLGEGDDVTKSFDPHNNFYYLPGTSFIVPSGYSPLGDLPHPTKDGKFNEIPAKVTGNNQFTPAPDINEWFETVKLNYGVDIQGGWARHFDPIPPTWYMMKEILLFWTSKGVDGFRCDMAEMVPVEFWNWVIPQIKEPNREIIFIAEIYNPFEYRNYIENGKFTYLYDKVGLYDCLRAIIQGSGSASNLTALWKELRGINNYMLRFLENHDEQRIASDFFAQNPFKAIPAMVVSATLNSGPVMIYFGQEVGEPGKGKAGFSGEDGRTTIFDYWGIPEHQKWMNGDKFDGALLSDAQMQLRHFYTQLFRICQANEAIRKGNLYDLQDVNRQGKGYNEQKIFTYLRFTAKQQLLVIVNFDDSHMKEVYLNIPENAFKAMGLATNCTYCLQDLFGKHKPINFGATQAIDLSTRETGIPLSLAPLAAHIFTIRIAD